MGGRGILSRRSASCVHRESGNVPVAGGITSLWRPDETALRRRRYAFGNRRDRPITPTGATLTSPGGGRYWVRDYFGTVGYPAWTQASHPPFRTETSVNPFSISRSATLALVCSLPQAQYRIMGLLQEEQRSVSGIPSHFPISSLVTPPRPQN
jgi:hypothetical protein